MITVALLGILAGGLTTVSGLGGGVLLVVALSLVWAPALALVTTALALLVSNLHRLWLYRSQVDGAAARGLVAGLFPGALVGGLLAVEVPDAVLRALIVGVVGLALLRAVMGWQVRLSRRALIPAAVVVGVLTATAGGAGLLVAPLLLATGVEGDRYIATTAFAAASLHVGRILGYGAGGLIDGAVVLLAAQLAIALVLGNLLGRAARDRLAPAARRRIEYGTLAACALLSVLGVA